MTWFTGTIYEERKEGYMVKFDDKDTKLMSQFSIEPVVPALHQYELKQEVKPKSTCLPDTKPDLKVDSSDAFRSLERKVFHLNPWIQSKKKDNQCFGPFIRESAVNFGSFPLTATTKPLLAMGPAGYGQLRQAIKDDLMSAADDRPHGGRYPNAYYRSTGDEEDFGLESLRRFQIDGAKAGAEATQMALYCSKVEVGDFFIMRHCYEECPYLPSFLANMHGGYPKKGVYAIGRVTRRIAPDSAEDARLGQKFSSQIESLWARDFHRVTFDRLGKLGDLHEDTQKYLSKICVATIMQVCSPTGNTSAVNAKRLRDDLWRNAKISISPEDFPENHVISRYGAARQPA